MALPDWYPATLSRQLAMIAQTWAALEQHGVTTSTPVQLDFTYSAPNELAADRLVAYLRLETDYDVDADHGRVVGGASEWSVVGSTHPTAVSDEILPAWVEWMVASGAEHGGCRFDGWGARTVGSQG